MKPLLIELQYLPPLSYYQELWRYQAVFIEACEHYQKGSYRNRCHIASSQGVLRLSIPLQKGKNEQAPVTQVRIAHEQPWRKLHWNSIKTAYRSAPFFEHYAPHFEKMYNREIEFLFDWNLQLFRLTLRLLKIDAFIVVDFTRAYLLQDATLDMTDYRNTIYPKKTGSKTGDATPYRKYPQLFEEKTGFLPDLSILDALFCCGPQAAGLIR